MFCKKKKNWFMKNQICCWKQIKRTFEGGFTFIRQIYYACITTTTTTKT